jgi:hypothetical protein
VLFCFQYLGDLSAKNGSKRVQVVIPVVVPFLALKRQYKQGKTGKGQ